MYLKTLSFMLIMGSIGVQSSQTTYFNSGNGNALIDSILKSVMKKYNNTLDPLHIPDKVIGFKHRVGIITFGAQLNLSEGIITGLSHIYRSGNSTLNSDKTGFTANIMFGNQNIKIHFKGDLSLMDLDTQITLESEVGEIGVTTQIGLASNGKLSLNEFNVNDLNNVRVNIKTPIFIFDPIINLITQEFIKVFNPMVKEQISIIVKDILAKELQNFKMPIG